MALLIKIIVWRGLSVAMVYLLISTLRPSFQLDRLLQDNTLTVVDSTVIAYNCRVRLHGVQLSMEAARLFSDLRFTLCLWLNYDIVVLTDNTSKYKEFIVTCNTKTHYIRPLMMKIRVIILIIITKELTTTRFYSFINGKIKKEPEKPWIGYKCSKNGQFRFFSASSSKFRGKRRIPQRGVKIRVPRNTAGPDRPNHRQHISTALYGGDIQRCWWLQEWRN